MNKLLEMGAWLFKLCPPNWYHDWQYSDGSFWNGGEYEDFDEKKHVVTRECRTCGRTQKCRYFPGMSGKPMVCWDNIN